MFHDEALSGPAPLTLGALGRDEALEDRSMDAWTAFGMFKLFLDIIDGGPTAAVKGVLMQGVPYSDLLDVGESVFGLFGLDGSYQGTIIVREADFVPLARLELLRAGDLSTTLASRDFPRLARLQFAQLQKPKFPDRRFPRFD